MVSIQKAVRSRYAFAMAAGLLLAAAFPNLGIAGLAWIAPGCILFSALGCAGGQAFRFGYVAGLAHYLFSLHWLLFIPFPLGAVAGWLALSAYLALYPAVWVWLCWRTFPFKLKPKEYPGTSFRWIEEFASTNAIQRAVWSVSCAIIWVALEMIVARLLTGFPWNILGASQYRILPIAQIASVTGVYGVSFLLIWFSVSLGCAALCFVVRPRASKLWFGDLFWPLLALAGAAVFGIRQISHHPTSDRVVTVALVQPSIPQTLIWDPNENTNRFNQLLRLSERALATKPEILIWPEAAVPNMLRYEPDTYEAITNLVRTRRVWMILGADDAVPRRNSTTKREFDFFNSSFLINPDGELPAVYRKRRLVIFGEYVPLSRWLPFMKYLTPIGGEFTPGDRPKPFVIPELNVKTSVLICFEDTFPHLTREYVEPDTDFLLNLTNNGWFGESAAQWQHAANAVFRAIENGLPLVRCANNGLTCWVDSIGGMHEVYFPDTQNIYGAGFKTARIPLLSPGQKREPTFYNRCGDWLGWSCVGLTLGMLVIGNRRWAMGDRN
jgi:apolipoprotein N-acyltransferase